MNPDNPDDTVGGLRGKGGADLIWPLSPPFVRNKQARRSDSNRDLESEKKRAREKAKASRKSKKKNRKR